MIIFQRAPQKLQPPIKEPNCGRQWEDTTHKQQTNSANIGTQMEGGGKNTRAGAIHTFLENRKKLRRKLVVANLKGEVEENRIGGWTAERGRKGKTERK